jgi:hypothetical protein
MNYGVAKPLKGVPPEIRNPNSIITMMTPGEVLRKFLVLALGILELKIA